MTRNRSFVCVKAHGEVNLAVHEAEEHYGAQKESRRVQPEAAASKGCRWVNLYWRTGR